MYTARAQLLEELGKKSGGGSGVKDPRTGFLLSFKPQLNPQHSAKPYLLLCDPYSMTVMILGWRKFYKDIS